MKYPRFKQALRSLAPTNRERAEKLGVSVRSIIYYLTTDMLPPAEKVKRHPELDDALSHDLTDEETPAELASIAA